MTAVLIKFSLFGLEPFLLPKPKAFLVLKTKPCSIQYQVLFRPILPAECFTVSDLMASVSGYVSKFSNRLRREPVGTEDRLVGPLAAPSSSPAMPVGCPGQECIEVIGQTLP